MPRWLWDTSGLISSTRAASTRSSPDSRSTRRSSWARFDNGRSEPISLRIDRDVLEWFRQGGAGYQTRINAVLRSYVDAMQTRARSETG
ncbi:MAG: BrnA antitoxin family protein [Gemmatimonadota bacterium]